MRQKPLFIALVCALVACLAPPAQAAGPLAPVGAAIKTAGPQLGKPTKADLTRRLGRAKAAYGRHQWCASVRELGGLVKATGRLKGARRAAGRPVGDAATLAQQTIFEAHATTTGYCGLKAPQAKVSASVKPTVKTVPNPSGGAPLPVAAMEGDHAKTDFVANEVVILSSDAAKVEKFAKKWKGSVVGHSDPTTPGVPDAWRVHVDASQADTSGLSGDLRKLDPLSRGTLKVSDGKGLDLIALAADAATQGLKIAPNILLGSNAVEDRTTTEQAGSGGGYNQDAYQIWYNKPGGSIGAGEAWRTLRIAGKESNRVLVGVVDGGFSDPQSDIAGKTNFGGPQNPIGCSGGASCPFHGSNVSSTIAGVPDNSTGIAGSAGSIADIRAYRMTTGTMFDGIDGVYDGFEHGAKVINISSGYGLAAIVSEFNIPYEDATQTAREHGTLVVASAGNSGEDVDAEDCFIVCWEETWIAPCENDAVVCVGGITGDDRKRADKSNYGYEWTSYAPTSDVDIFAPWSAWVAGDGANGTVHQVSGTSFSSPFVAGVAAEMFAANPSLTPQQVEQGLKATASNSSDTKVSRVVDADQAVKWALNGIHIPPFVKVTTPDGLKAPYGGLGGTKLQAKVYKLYDNDPACCSVRWNSPQDGLLGTGTDIDALCGAPGDRTVTVTATDNAGASATASIGVTATNQGPSLTVVKPAPGGTVYKAIPTKFQASAADPNEIAGLSCDRIHWKVTGTALPTQEADGCQPTFTFAANGARTLEVKVTDAYGATSTSTRTFNVVNAPLNAPPLVTILTPDKGDSLDPNTKATLTASAIDPDTGLPVTGSWSVKDGSTVSAIGAGNSIQWKPSTNVPFHCGGTTVTLIFTAADGDGTSTDQVDVSVPYPVC